MGPVGTPGFRIYLNTRRPTAERLQAFTQVPTGNVADAMDRLGAMDLRIKPLDLGSRLCGPALTVRTRPGDNLMVWKALDISRPGDVLVIATYGFLTTSTLGENVVKVAAAKGLAGIVTDGACRDASGIRTTGLPVFCAGLIPSSPSKDGPGEIGGSVSCGGIPVDAGDLIVGDEDGIVVVPFGDLDAVAKRLAAIEQKEAAMEASIAAGQFIPAWVDTVLEEKTCEYVDLAAQSVTS
jgi:regulator of RNase E activity RraA